MVRLSEIMTVLSGHTGLLLFFAMVGLLIATFTEQLQLYAKYRGAELSTVAAGYNNAMKIMVFNRLGAVFYFLLVAMAIDFGTGPTKLTYFMGAVMLVLAVCSFTMLLILGNEEEVPGASLFSSLCGLKLKGQLVVVMSLVATIFNLMGLTIPMILGAYFPEYRLTLVNTGFLFNAVFTLVSVFIIENYIAYMIDKKSEGLLVFARLIFLARGIGAIATGVFLIVFFG